jgi:hypothetical protein
MQSCALEEITRGLWKKRFQLVADVSAELIDVVGISKNDAVKRECDKRNDEN